MSKEHLHIESLNAPPPDFLKDYPEGEVFYRDFQNAKIPEFAFHYFEVKNAERTQAVIPCFEMNFSLDTMLPSGWLKKLLSGCCLKLACVGHPSTDIGHMDGEISEDVLELTYQELTKISPLVAFKGFPDDLPLAPQKWVKTRGFPVPVLHLKPDYWESLPSARRRMIRQKRALSEKLRIEEVETLPPELLPDIFRLYLNTYNKAETKFEKLNSDYFRETRDISKYLLFFLEDRLIGFSQLLPKKPYMVFRYIGMDYDYASDHGVYFAMFIKTIDICLRDGYTEIDWGATSYDFKKRLGSDLQEAYIYYRHKNPLIHWFLAQLKTLAEPSKKELS